MRENLDDRAERILRWLRLLRRSKMRDEVIALIQELLALTFRLEQERDDLLAKKFIIR